MASAYPRQRPRLSSRAARASSVAPALRGGQRVVLSGGAGRVISVAPVLHNYVRISDFIGPRAPRLSPGSVVRALRRQLPPRTGRLLPASELVEDLWRLLRLPMLSRALRLGLRVHPVLGRLADVWDLLQLVQREGVGYAEPKWEVSPGWVLHGKCGSPRGGPTHWSVSPTAQPSWVTYSNSCLAGQAWIPNGELSGPVEVSARSILLLHRYPVAGSYRYQFVEAWVWPDTNVRRIEKRGGVVLADPRPVELGGPFAPPVPVVSPLVRRWWNYESGSVPSSRTELRRITRREEWYLPQDGVEWVIERGGQVSERPSEPVGPSRPPQGTREGKVRTTAGRVALLAGRLYGGVTEVRDVVEALHSALPGGLQVRGGLYEQALAVWRNWRSVDVGEAVYRLALDAVVDHVIGRLSPRGPRDWYGRSEFGLDWGGWARRSLEVRVEV